LKPNPHTPHFSATAAAVHPTPSQLPLLCTLVVSVVVAIEDGVWCRRLRAASDPALTVEETKGSAST